MSGSKMGASSSAFLARVNGASLKTALVQDHGQCIGNNLFVVGNQDLGFGVVFGHTLLKAQIEAPTLRFAAQLGSALLASDLTWREERFHY